MRWLFNLTETVPSWHEGCASFIAFSPGKDLRTLAKALLQPQGSAGSTQGAMDSAGLDAEHLRDLIESVSLLVQRPSVGRHPSVGGSPFTCPKMTSALFSDPTLRTAEHR